MSKNYSSDKHRNDNFDYENARRDLWDAGIDPDYLSSTNRQERDSFLQRNGFNPKSYGSKYDGSSGNSGGSDSDCFLTTACIKAKGLPDDCMELQTLRAYRDNWLKSTEAGRIAVAHYYDIAPRIVAAIDAEANADRIWTQLYDELVIPCVRLIKSCKNDEAFTLYRDCTMRLEEQYLR